MHFEKTTNGIEYTEALVSCEGAGFTLYTTAEHTPGMIKKAIAEIRRQRDVVFIRVAGEKDRNERYREGRSAGLKLMRAICKCSGIIASKRRPLTNMLAALCCPASLKPKPGTSGNSGKTYWNTDYLLT
jgi:hypothetical protein